MLLSGEKMMMQSNLNIILSGLIFHLFLTNTFLLANPIPDTGQKQSYTDTYGEDSDYLMNPPEFTKMDASGFALPENSETWTCVKDTVTGLLWEIKTDDDSNTDKDNMLNWTSANAHIQWLNANQFGGYSDWRLPTVLELQTIVQYEAGDSFFRDFFPHTMLSFYWTQNSSAITESIAWAVNFDNGTTWYHFKNSPHYVRGVRGHLSDIKDMFFPFDERTVSDVRTGLMWQRNSSDNAISWDETLTYCQNISLSGFTDWRLPNKKELISIMDYAMMNPSLPESVFTDTQMSAYWTSTVDPSSTAKHAWCIYMDMGYDGDSQNGNANARCVRGGQHVDENHINIWHPSFSMKSS